MLSLSSSWSEDVRMSKAIRLLPRQAFYGEGPADSDSDDSPGRPGEAVKRSRERERGLGIIGSVGLLHGVV